MLLTFPAIAAAATNFDVNRVPTGQGIDFLIWPVMIGAFIYIVYLTTRKNPSDKGNKDKKS
jgi:hypothetical protein